MIHNELPHHPVLDRYARLRNEIARLRLHCLEDKWLGPWQKHRFQCDSGHIFSKTLESFLRHEAKGCMACLKFGRMQALRDKADEAGVECLETEWLGHRTLYRFRCLLGHEWLRTARSALQNPNCSKCMAGIPRQESLLPGGLERLRETAEQRGGSCLTTVYQGISRSYRFVCAHGHVWDARGASILAGTWCPRCANRKVNSAVWQSDGMLRLHGIAQRLGGQCLTKEYRGTHAHYRFRCREGHTWETKGTQVLNKDSWCPICVNQSKSLRLEDAQEMALKRGGLCLSTCYVNTLVKLHWQCHRGHAWWSAFSNIRAGHWCPTCAHINQITNPKSKARIRYESLPLE